LFSSIDVSLVALLIRFQMHYFSNIMLRHIGCSMGVFRCLFLFRIICLTCSMNCSNSCSSMAPQMESQSCPGASLNSSLCISSRMLSSKPFQELGYKSSLTSRNTFREIYLINAMTRIKGICLVRYSDGAGKGSKKKYVVTRILLSE